jgi:hypothetical protein
VAAPEPLELLRELLRSGWVCSCSSMASSGSRTSARLLPPLPLPLLLLLLPPPPPPPLLSSTSPSCPAWRRILECAGGAPAGPGSGAATEPFLGILEALSLSASFDTFFLKDLHKPARNDRINRYVAGPRMPDDGQTRAAAHTIAIGMHAPAAADGGQTARAAGHMRDK